MILEPENQDQPISQFIGDYKLHENYFVKSVFKLGV